MERSFNAPGDPENGIEPNTLEAFFLHAIGDAMRRGINLDTVQVTEEDLPEERLSDSNDPEVNIEP